MGKIVTHELHSGGRARPVTNDNKYASTIFSQLRLLSKTESNHSFFIFFAFFQFKLE